MTEEPLVIGPKNLPSPIYCNNICVYDEQPIAGREIQCRAPDSWSRCTTPFDDIIK